MNTIAERESLDVRGTAEAVPALEIAGLQAWYGESHILHGVDLTVPAGRSLAVVGAATARAAPPRCARSWV